MLKVRRASERGHASHGWLETYHTFSFAGYFDPEFVNFRSLRVMNEDFIAGGGGFPTHPHDNMEIITIILDGALEHKDSMGNSSVIKPGEIQKMSAGTGITHSEYNHSSTEPVHLYQIWIMPDTQGVEPGYHQNLYPGEDRKGKLLLVGSNDGRDGSVMIRQDVSLYVSSLDPGDEISHELGESRFAWLQVTSGDLEVNGELMGTGDGLVLENETLLSIKSVVPSEFMLFDMA